MTFEFDTYAYSQAQLLQGRGSMQICSSIPCQIAFLLRGWSHELHGVNAVSMPSEILDEVILLWVEQCHPSAEEGLG